MNKSEQSELHRLLKELLFCTEASRINSLLSRLDQYLIIARLADARLAHFLERRSYQKALSYLEEHLLNPDKV